MNNQTYQEIIGEIGTVITIVSPLIVAFLGAYKLKIHEFIKAKINCIKDDNLKKVTQNTLDRVESLTTSTITMIDSTVKPQIIENIKNGTMTKDNLSSLKQQCIDTVKKQLTTEGLADLQNTIGDVNTYMDTLVESKLADLKVDNTSSVSKTKINMPTQQELDAIDLQNKLTQAQIEKDNLSQQLNQVSNDKVNIEQANNQLTQQNQQLSNQVNDLNNQIQQLINDKQTIQSKLDTINATLNQGSQVVANNTTTDNVQTVVQ